MSLINQMLKDLEQRRSQDLEGDVSIIPGIKRYSVARHRKTSPWLIMLVSVSFVLLVVVTWLLWEKMAQSQQVASTQGQVVTSQAKQSNIVKTTSTKTQPAIVKTPVENQTRSESTVADDKSSKAEAEPAPVVKKKIVKTISGDDAKVDSAPAGTVKKISRSLKPEQQAAVYYKKGHALLSGGQNTAGEQALRKALEVYPQHIKAREILAGLYIKTGRVVEAGDLLEAGLLHNPGHHLFAMLQARLLLQQNRAQAASHVLEKNAPAVSDNLDYHALLAVAYQKQAQHAKTVSKYQEVLTVKPTTGVWWVGMAISLEALARQQEAADAYNKARKTGTLGVDLLRYADSRLAALRDSGYSHND